jgi:hypothetical protein
MSDQYIFISCGQFTEAEKSLGKQIASMVRELTGFQPFFAEEVQDLNGLDTNILNALRECVAFITVLHPRGEITRPDKSVLTRASVWIEQEIAIATYIQRAEERPLPIIAFKHVSVGREGIRDLLQLNPIEFTDEAEVLAALPAHLEKWKSLTPSGIEVRLSSAADRVQDGHRIRRLDVTLVNDTSKRITDYDCMVELSSCLLAHDSASYPSEVPSGDGTLRRFRFDETHKGSTKPRVLLPHGSATLMTFNYCTACADAAGARTPRLAASRTVEAKIWINGHEYSEKKTIMELAIDAERRGAY